jgi:hypothetical protein
MKWITKKLDQYMEKYTGPVSEKHKNFGTAEEWCDYHQRQKTKCPKVYRIYKFLYNIDIWFSVRYQKYILDPKYWLKNIFIHPQWMVRAKTLKIGHWQDTLTRVLHINMEMLRYYIEQENHNYNNDDGDFEPWEVKEFKKKERGEPSQFDGEYGLSMEQYQNKQDAWDIYLWWKDYPNREKEIENLYHEIPRDDTDDDDCILKGFTKEEMEKKKPYYDKIHEMEKKLEQEEQDNLIKLMKIRFSLWS